MNSQMMITEMRAFFAPDARTTVRSAPGRVDVMGGISDYAGGLVLEGPIAERATVAAAIREDRRVRILTVGPEAPEANMAEWDLDDCLPAGETGAPRLCSLLESHPELKWSAYAAGIITSLAFHRPELAALRTGWDILVESNVPGSAGVSSSAALEVAVLRTLTVALGLKIQGLEAARICQWAENRVAGAPCGIMDQVTSALGQAGSLIVLLCQPCELLGEDRLPEGVEISCLNSNVKHSVGGSHYTSARVGAFMGLQMLRSAGVLPTLPGPQNDGSELRYLCEIDEKTYRDRCRALLPDRILGSEYLERWGSYPDTVTRVDPGAYYHVRSCTSHPILERWRVERFRRFIHRACNDETSVGREQGLRAAGLQMYASDWSYNYRVGLGSRETRILVRLVRQLGAERGFYGARVTGGGAGGTVAVLHEKASAEELEGLMKKYERAAGIPGRILRGASDGPWA